MRPYSQEWNAAEYARVAYQTLLTALLSPLPPSPHRPVLSDGQGKPFTAELIANTYRPDREGAIVYRPSQILHPLDAYGSLITATVGLRLTILEGERSYPYMRKVCPSGQITPHASLAG
jgi:hypothetical protein